VLAAIDAEHREGDLRAVTPAELDACAIDGSLIRVSDTAANREAFGSAGTGDDSAPYPQLRELRCTQASNRAALGVVAGPAGAVAGGRGQGRSRAGAAGQGADRLPADLHPSA
jgi:hypothetical protein